MAYAQSTSVAVEKTIADIVTMVRKAGALQIGQIEDRDAFAVQFTLRERMVRFTVRMPEAVGLKRGARPASPQEVEATRAQWRRQRARALMLVIKAKLESVESDVETFEEAFLANVVMSDGKTLYERVKEPLAIECQTGKVVTSTLSLPDYSR